MSLMWIERAVEFHISVSVIQSYENELILTKNNNDWMSINNIYTSVAYL